MKLNVLRADPAGNITLFVLDPVDQAVRADVAAQLMKRSDFKAEQVGFLCPPEAGGEGRMEMMGGEFCGNATRAFGLLVAQRRGSCNRVQVEVSGCDHIVTVEVDLDAGTARSEMPLPQEIRQVTVDGHTGTFVHLSGIAHLVVEDAPATEEFFQKAEPLFQDVEGLDGYGVIFLEGTDTMIPLVKIPATQTLIWEGSCGSGSVAAAIARSQNQGDGTYSYDYVQPAGVIRATICWEQGRAMAAYIGGSVSLDAATEVEL